MLYQRNLIGSMLVRRNDEVYLLYEKIRLIENILNRGKLSYAKLEQKLTTQNAQVEMLRKQLSLFDSCRNEMKILRTRCTEVEMSRDLEIGKRKALEDHFVEQNIHRWRLLKGVDPNVYELIAKVKILQTRLIRKNQDLAELYAKFDEKDKLFIEIKAYFRRHMMSEEMAALVLKQRHDLDEKNRKIKVIKAY